MSGRSIAARGPHVTPWMGPEAGKTPPGVRPTSDQVIHSVSVAADAVLRLVTPTTL